MNHRMRALTTVAGAALVCALVGLGGNSAHQVRAQSVTTITLQGDQFQPHDITINAGDTVSWVNAEDQLGGTGAVHDLLNYDDGSQIDPDLLHPGDLFSLEFDTPGFFHYFCDLHPGMNGTITVQ